MPGWRSNNPIGLLTQFSGQLTDAVNMHTMERIACWRRQLNAVAYRHVERFHWRHSKCYQVDNMNVNEFSHSHRHGELPYWRNLRSCRHLNLSLELLQKIPSSTLWSPQPPWWWPRTFRGQRLWSLFEAAWSGTKIRRLSAKTIWSKQNTASCRVETFDWRMCLLKGICKWVPFKRYPLKGTCRKVSAERYLPSSKLISIAVSSSIWYSGRHENVT